MYFGFQNISVAYGKQKILEDIHMDFEKGKITAIIGPNGCGKSSLLKTVSRAVTPIAGTAILEDKPLRSYAGKELAKRIAYLPQLRVSPRDIDVRTLVSYGRYPYRRFGGGLTGEDKRIIDEALSLTGLLPIAGRLLNGLSGGERQRAWIAMTICQQPEVLLLDEPTTYLDAYHHRLSIARYEFHRPLCGFPLCAQGPPRLRPRPAAADHHPGKDAGGVQHRLPDSAGRTKRLPLHNPGKASNRIGSNVCRFFISFILSEKRSST